MSRRIIIWLVMAIVLLSAAHAVGIAPGHVDVAFEPNSVQQIKLKILNQERQDFQVMLYAEGELAQYITIDEPMLSFTPSETEKYAYYTLRLPAGFDKQGLHSANVVARTLPAGGSTGSVGMTSSVAVVSKLNVMVPYSGLYAEVTLFTPNFEQDVENNFAAEVKNLGTLDILKGRVVIDVYNPSNVKVASLTSDDFNLASGQNTIVTVRWKPEVGAGSYRAVANLIYGTSNARDERPFTIGKLTIDIVDITVKDFRLGGIAMFDILLENKWNEDIPGVFGDIKITDESGKTYTTFKTASVDIGAAEKQSIQAYWDTKTVGPGNYKLDIALNYLGQKAEKVFDILVSADKIETNLGGQVVTETQKQNQPVLQGIYILTFLVILLIIFNVIMYFRKSKK